MNTSNILEIGLGYRDKYFISLVKYFDNYGYEKFINEIMVKSTDEKLKMLMEMKGIGYKVACCIALFSLNAFDLVPVDTHIFSFAKTNLKLKQKEMKKAPNIKDHIEINSIFRE